MELNIFKKIKDRKKSSDTYAMNNDQAISLDVLESSKFKRLEDPSLLTDVCGDNIQRQDKYLEIGEIVWVHDIGEYKQMPISILWHDPDSKLGLLIGEPRELMNKYGHGIWDQEVGWVVSSADYKWWEEIGDSYIATMRNVETSIEKFEGNISTDSLESLFDLFSNDLNKSETLDSRLNLIKEKFEVCKYEFNEKYEQVKIEKAEAQKVTDLERRSRPKEEHYNDLAQGISTFYKTYYPFDWQYSLEFGLGEEHGLRQVLNLLESPKELDTIINDMKQEDGFDTICSDLVYLRRQLNQDLSKRVTEELTEALNAQKTEDIIRILDSASPSTLAICEFKYSEFNELYNTLNHIPDISISLKRKRDHFLSLIFASEERENMWEPYEEDLQLEDCPARSR